MPDFVLVLLTSLEYWFRVLDLDNDGILSTHELHFFFEEQRNRMQVHAVSSLLPLPYSLSLARSMLSASKCCICVPVFYLPGSSSVLLVAGLIIGPDSVRGYSVSAGRYD